MEDDISVAEDTEIRSTRSRRGKAAPKPPVTPAKKTTRASRAKKQAVEETSESEDVETIIEQSVSMVVSATTEDLDGTGRKTPESIQVLEQLQELITPVYEPEPENVQETHVVQEDLIEEYVSNVQDAEELVDAIPEQLEVEELDQNPSMDITEAIEENENFNNDAVAIETVDGVEENHEIFETMEVDQNTTASSGNAIAEDLENGLNENDDTKTGLDADMVSEEELPVTLNVENAEVVSDEELPAVPKEAVKDAEEVSDDELPGPKMAELPADTEVVSEEELPASTKKRKAEDGYDPNSPTETTSVDIPEKKLKTADEEKAAEKEKVPEKPKKLPELDKYWKAVNDDVSDFTAWTYLLQYVDQENDIDAAREAYDAFLAHYPYCYGYWRKYADYEKRKGNKKKCEEVFERGIKAIPLSVDLWIHYLTHVKANYTDNEAHIRAQFERALAACGLEFRSDKLYEAYIKWENESKNISNIVSIYDRLLATPTQGYNKHYDDLQDVVNNNPVNKLVSVELFRKLRADVRADSKDQGDAGTDDLPPGEDEPDDHVRNEDEAQKIVDKIMSSKKKVHKANIQAVTARWTYEEGIKRPYFHVKPLERCQLKNWKEYLDYEIEQGDQKRILVLFERCLIACALYDDFWLKLIRYLEDQNNATESPELVGRIRDAYERACSIHHPDKPTLHIMWAAFEEVQTNYAKSADILTNLDKTCPNLLQVAYRRINLERRRGDFEKCGQLYEHYIAQAKNKNVAGSLAIKHARFLHKIQGNLDAGYAVLQAVLEKDPANTRVALQMIDLALQRPTVDENEVLAIMELFMSRDNIEPDQKVLFAQRRVEFLEDFGSSAKMLQEAQRSLQVALTKASEAKKKAASDAKKAAKDSQPPLPSSTNPSSASYSSAGYAYTPTNSTYYSNSASGYHSYGSGDGYGQYGQWTGQYPQSNYGNYNQWSSYGGSYY